MIHTHTDLKLKEVTGPEGVIPGLSQKPKLTRTDIKSVAQQPGLGVVHELIAAYDSGLRAHNQNNCESAVAHVREKGGIQAVIWLSELGARTIPTISTAAFEGVVKGLTMLKVAAVTPSFHTAVPLLTLAGLRKAFRELSVTESGTAEPRSHSVLSFDFLADQLGWNPGLVGSVTLTIRGRVDLGRIQEAAAKFPDLTFSPQGTGGCLITGYGWPGFRETKPYLALTVTEEPSRNRTAISCEGRELKPAELGVNSWRDVAYMLALQGHALGILRP